MDYDKVEYLTELDPETDLNQIAIQGRLESILEPIDETGRKQLDRCLYITFVGQFKTIFDIKNAEGLYPIYFTEDNERDYTKHLAWIEIYMQILVYAESLALLSKDTDYKYEAEEDVHSAARAVFGHADFSRPDPMEYMGRPDMQDMTRFVDRLLRQISSPVH